MVKLEKTPAQILYYKLMCRYIVYKDEISL